MIPIIEDVNDLNKLFDCFNKSGFCYIHIDNIKLINQTYNYVKDFFDEDTKNTLLMDKNGIGYIPKNRYSKKENIIEIKEQFTYRPSEINIGEKYNNQLNDYYNYMSNFAKIIFNNLLRCINIEKRYDESFNTLTLLHYKKDNIHDDLGIGMHSDWGWITILWTDNDGLQIKNENNEWIDIPNIKDHFIINIGDMLELLSSGKYKSTVHRVKVKEEKYSMAFFYEPSLDSIITPIKYNEKYFDISFKEYIDLKLKESYDKTYTN